MPLEGHWDRQTTPLRSLQGRERRILAVFLVVVALGCVGVVIAAVSTGGASADPPGCLTVSLPGVMGAAEQHHCGAEAQRLCAHPEGRGSAGYVAVVREACRRAGIVQAH